MKYTDKEFNNLQSETWKNLVRLEKGQLEMTPVLMYECVLSLALLMGPECGYEETMNGVVGASKPDWITNLVQSMLDVHESIKVGGLDFKRSWASVASELLFDLIWRHGMEYKSLATPLLNKKETRSDFFWLVCQITDFKEYDVLDVITHYADQPSDLENDELQLYAELLTTQNPEKAIHLLEKLRATTPNFQANNGFEIKAFHGFLDSYSPSLGRSYTGRHEFSS